MFTGAYVKTVQPNTFIPSIHEDVRPIRVIVGFGTLNGNPSAITILDSIIDSTSTTVHEELELSTLELFTSHSKNVPDYVYYNKVYWLVLGREHSLLKAMKVTDFNYNIEFDLISDNIITEIISKNDMETISNISLNTLLVPLNLSKKPLISMVVDSTSTTVSMSATPNQTIYAKLSPIDTTENTITWTIVTPNGSNLITLQPNTDTRICVLTFTAVGIVTIKAKSVENPNITITETFTITA
jgi:hypothetical protein